MLNSAFSRRPRVNIAPARPFENVQTGRSIARLREGRIYKA